MILLLTASLSKMNIKIENYINKIRVDNKKLILIGLLCVIVVYIDYSFILKPQVSGINSAKNKIKKITAELGTFNKEASSGAALNNEQDKGPGLKKELITQDQLPQLLEEISQAANKNNIRIMQITPLQNVKPASSAGSKAITIKLELIAGYHGLGGFVNDLENSAKFLMLDGLKIKREQADLTKEAVSLELKTYVKK